MHETQCLMSNALSEFPNELTESLLRLTLPWDLDELFICNMKHKFSHGDILLQTHKLQGQV